MRPGVYLGPFGVIVLALLAFTAWLALAMLCVIVLAAWLIGAGIRELLLRIGR